MIKTLSAIVLLIILCSAQTTVLADVLELPATAGAPTVTAVPEKGQTMKAVLHQFGQPQLRHRPAGGDTPRHPPITRWDYAGFSVFFEHAHVVDAVIPGDPPKVYHDDHLRAAN